MPRRARPWWAREQRLSAVILQQKHNTLSQTSNQKSNETAYLWKKDFSPHIDSIQYYIDKTKDYANLIKTELKFHPTYKHTKLPIVGELDILTEDTIIDIKITSSLQKKKN